MANQLYIPSINPVTFYNRALTQIPKYFTKHFDDYPFELRSHPWLQQASFERIWQVTDIINLQFISSFDPITVQLVDQYGNVKINLPALIGLPNKFIAGTYAFEVSMSLAGLNTGCYKVVITAGTGDGAITLTSGCQYISSDPMPETICIEYFNSRFTKDVIFETGVKFQIRVQGWIDYDRSGRAVKQEYYRNQPYTNELLSSKSARNFPVYFGDAKGLPTDVTDLIEQIWECDNVSIDGAPFGIADGAKIEFTDIEGYRLRGMKTTIEPGINRNSRLYSVNTDTTQRLMSTIIVSAKVFGDTSNQGSTNTVPVYNVEIEQ